MRRNKIAGIDGDVIVIGGVSALLYFFVIKPLLNTGTNQDLIDEQALPPTQNPFSYQFQPFVDFFNNNTPTITASSAGNFFSMFLSLSTPSDGTTTTNNSPSMSDFFKYLKNNPGAPSPWGYLDTADLSARAEHLKAAIDVSPLNPIATSDQSAATSAFAGLTKQLQIAFIACYFWYNWNLDLLSYLHGSLFSPGLTPANLSALIQTVNALPVQ